MVRKVSSAHVEKVREAEKQARREREKVEAQYAASLGENLVKKLGMDGADRLVSGIERLSASDLKNGALDRVLEGLPVRSSRANGAANAEASDAAATA